MTSRCQTGTREVNWPTVAPKATRFQAGWTPSIWSRAYTSEKLFVIYHGPCNPHDYTAIERDSERVRKFAALRVYALCSLFMLIPATNSRLPTHKSGPRSQTSTHQLRKLPTSAKHNTVACPSIYLPGSAPSKTSLPIRLHFSPHIFTESPNALSSAFNSKLQASCTARRHAWQNAFFTSAWLGLW